MHSCLNIVDLDLFEPRRGQPDAGGEEGDVIDLREPRRMTYYELVDRRDYLKRELAKCTDEKDRAVWAEALRDCERALERMEEEG